MMIDMRHPKSIVIEGVEIRFRKYEACQHRGERFYESYEAFTDNSPVSHITKGSSYAIAFQRMARKAYTLIQAEEWEAI